MHIVRNSMDHGIESAQNRLDAGKAEAGTIKFEIVDKGDAVELQISDDGRGLALHKLYEKAVSSGLYSKDASAKAQDVAELIFNSGLSTAESVTQVSGRGVGMDAVKSFLGKQGATIDIVLSEIPDTLKFTPFKFIITIPQKLYTL